MEKHSLDDWWRFINYGRELRREEYMVLAGQIGILLGGEQPKKKILSTLDETPDRAEFHKHFGKKIKHPPKE